MSNCITTRYKYYFFKQIKPSLFLAVCQFKNFVVPQLVFYSLLEAYLGIQLPVYYGARIRMTRLKIIKSFLPLWCYRYTYVGHDRKVRFGQGVLGI
jgi:hypothetical protein